MTARLTLKSAGATSAGHQRTNNEDRFAIREPADAPTLASAGCLYLIADGIGGKDDGERASQYAVDTAMAVYYGSNETDSAARLIRAFEAANSGLASQGPAGRLGSTLVSAAVLGDQLIVAHVGDSRAYLCRDGVVQRLTHDHSFMQRLIDVGELTTETARDFKRKNVLTRSIGGGPQIEVDLSQQVLRPGDLLLLATDGLHQYFWHDPELQPFLTSDLEPDVLARRLVAEAEKRGGADNITAVVVKTEPPAPDRPAPAPAAPAARPGPAVQRSASPAAAPRARRRKAQPGRPVWTGIVRYWPAALVAIFLAGAGLAGGFLAGRWAAARNSIATAPPPISAETAPTSATNTAAEPTSTRVPAAIEVIPSQPPSSATPTASGPALCAWRIQSGQVLGRIAKASLNPGDDPAQRQNQIVSLNGLASPDSIAAGAILAVPWTNAAQPLDPAAPALAVPGQGSLPVCPGQP